MKLSFGLILLAVAVHGSFPARTPQTFRERNGKPLSETFRVRPDSPTASERLEIKMCDFEVPPELARANATFSVLYAIQVGDDGRPAKIEKVKNDLLGNDPFVACIQSWTLSVKNKRLVALFDWKHGQGWSGLTISGGDLEYRISFDPGAFSQYGRTASGE